MTKRGRYGDGSITQRGANSFRLRYRIGKQRFAKTVHGTHAEAKKELRALLRSGDVGTHIDPSKKTLTQWADHWLASGAPGRQMEAVGTRSIERYGQLLRVHVLPVLGAYKLQELDSTQIDTLYLAIEGKIAPPLSGTCIRHLARASRQRCGPRSWHSTRCSR
jgi:integrase